MKERNTSSNFSKLKSELERRLIIMRYSQVTTKKYFKIFGWVEDYLKGYGETNYTQELGRQFLIEYQLQFSHCPSDFQNAKVLIRHIDEILENKVFTIRLSKETSLCPTRFAGVMEEYLENLSKRGYSGKTIIDRKIYTGRLLACFPETVLTPQELTAADLYKIFTKYKWSLSCLAAIRCFLSFLYKNNKTKTDMTPCVPRPNRPQSLPSVYSREEVKRLLSSVDRGGSLGKRDFAILMLASHLGLRNSDIANLSFKNIDRTAKTIEIIQVKTGRSVKLVMNKDVEEAIDDYIQNSRPQSSSGKIFLCFKAPFSPLLAESFYGVANKYFKLAGIASQGRKCGIHSLRASYATALVSKGVPYVIVKEALGHKDQESSKYYVRIDAKRLRMCALDVPKPAGAFAVLLEPEVRNELEGVLK